MKALFIGGTGTISSAISALCVRRGWDVTLLNRGNADARVPEGAHLIHVDIHDETAAREALEGQTFDVVADFIAYPPDDVARDIRLYAGRTGQYLSISTASAYQRPLSSPGIREGTPLCNPYWEYSRLKAACEDVLIRAYREQGFPITIIRPSHTYSQRSVPVALHGPAGSFQVLERMRAGKPAIVPGDGLTLWTLTHSDDFAVAFVGLMGNVHALGEVFHITGDESLTWNQVYSSIAAALGVEPHLVHIASETLGALCQSYVGSLLGDKSNTVLFDNAKIKRAVPEFVAAKRFDQGVREAVAYIYSHPECQRPDPAFDAWCDQVIEGYERLTAALPKFEM